MSLQLMTKNPFTLVKNDGRRIEFRGLLTQKTLTTFNHNLLLEDGNLVERSLPNGTVEQFQVMDTGFHPGPNGPTFLGFYRSSTLFAATFRF